MVAAEEKVFRRRGRARRRLALMLLLLAAAFLLVERNPEARHPEHGRGKVHCALATRLINEAMNEATDGRVDYADLMHVICDEAGRVSMVQGQYRADERSRHRPW